MNLQYEVSTYLQDDKITQELWSLVEETRTKLSTTVMHLQEDGIRRKLIEAGWTPPDKGEQNRMRDWNYDAVGIDLYLLYLNHKLQDYKATEDKVKDLYLIEEKKYESKLLNKLFRFKYKDSLTCMFDNWASYSSKIQEIESEIARTEYMKSRGFGRIVPSACMSMDDFYTWVKQKQEE